MTDERALSTRLSKARKHLMAAHQRADTWPEDMEHTMQAVDALGIQHYGQAGEELPERIIEAQVRAMADLTYTYAEQAYEAKGDELTHHDDDLQEEFEEELDRAHYEAVGALRKVEDDDD